MRPPSAVLLILGIPLLLAASLPDPSPQAARGANPQSPAGTNISTAPRVNPPASTAVKMPGLKMIIHNDFAGNTSEMTLYVERDRSRREYRNAEVGVGSNGFFNTSSVNIRYGPHLVGITRCDLGQAFELNLDAQEYVVSAYPPKPLNLSKAEADALRQSTPQPAVAGNPTLRIETTTTDTGERKQIFGHTARHVVTTSRTVPLEGSKTSPEETRVDGWYIDLDTHVACEPKWPTNKKAFTYLSAANAPAERIEFISHGDPVTGFPVEVKRAHTRTMTLSDGTTQEHTFSNQSEVTLLEQSPLDPELFAVPSGFRKVDEIERNPPRSLTNQLNMAWEEFKAGVSRIFE